MFKNNLLFGFWDISQRQGIEFVLIIAINGNRGLNSIWMMRQRMFFVSTSLSCLIYSPFTLKFIHLSYTQSVLTLVPEFKLLGLNKVDSVWVWFLPLAQTILARRWVLFIQQIHRFLIMPGTILDSESKTQGIYSHKHILQEGERFLSTKCIKCEEVVSAVGEKKVLNAPGSIRKRIQQ